jgi:hypothetical protein
MASILSNLYKNAILYDLGDNEYLLERQNIVIPDSIDVIYHKVLAYDRIDLIAYKYYGNKTADSSNYWWVIADANLIDNPLDLSDYVGKEIIIPDLLTVKLIL